MCSSLGDPHPKEGGKATTQEMVANGNPPPQPDPLRPAQPGETQTFFGGVDLAAPQEGWAGVTFVEVENLDPYRWVYVVETIIDHPGLGMGAAYHL